jgi:hypothetical protein
MGQIRQSIKSAQNHAAAATAITPVRSASGYVLFSPEADATVSSITALNNQRDAIDEQRMRLGKENVQHHRPAKVAGPQIARLPRRRQTVSELRLRLGGSHRRGVDVDPPSTAVKTDGAIHQRKQGPITADTDIAAGLPPRAVLAA